MIFAPSFCCAVVCIKAAIEGDRYLGGSAFDTRVTEMRDQGPLAIGDVTYLTATFAVTVIAAG